MAPRSRIIGHGGYLPSNLVTNDDLVARGVDTSDAWIVQRTGIKERRIAADGEFTSDLAIAAARAALENAGIEADTIDAVVLATTSPDLTFPATAMRVQAAIGARNAFAFDLQAVCAGFIYALSVADSLIVAGRARRALVIGAETMSRLVDWKDRSTCVLFGDGAGAVVIEASEGDGTPTDRGVLAVRLRADGGHLDLLKTDGGPSTTGTVGRIRMAGQEVFRHAVVNLSAVVDEVLGSVGLGHDAVDWLVPHQANLRIIDGIARKLKLAPERVVRTVDRHGNTSSASIPLALTEAAGDGRIKPGDLVLMEGIGGGLTWGAALVRW